MSIFAEPLMVIAAVRYCIGRRTYIVEVCCSWIVSNWKEFDQGTRDIIKRDLEEEFTTDNALRADAHWYNKNGTYPLGDNADRALWERVRELWIGEVKNEG